jgi:hypothetical protein
MAEKKLLDSEFGLLQFAIDGFKYNLQTFPDTISAAAFLFTILFQSPPLGALTGSILALNVIAPMLQKFISGFIGDSAVVNREGDTRASFPSCSGHFPGVSFERILQLSDTKSFSDLDHNGFPSYYSLFLGFITAYVSALPVIYSKEISYSPKRQASTTMGLVILSIVVLMCTIYRVLSSCENIISLSAGLVAGALVGLLCVGFLSYISDRRLTNILSFPLIRNRAADGKPIYVCEKAFKKPPPTCVKPMTQQEKTNLQTVRSVIENGSKKLGIPISSNKLDEFATFYANNVDSNTGRLDGQAQNQALTILGITMEQSEQIMRAGRQ